MIELDRTKLDSLLADMSYYNAAEGSWSKEHDARTSAKIALKEYVKLLQDQGVDVEQLYHDNRMLTCKSDWGI